MAESHGSYYSIIRVLPRCIKIIKNECIGDRAWYWKDCDKVLEFSTSEVWTSKDCEATSKDFNSGVKVWKDIYGFCGLSFLDIGKFDFILVVVNRLTKSSHSIPIRVDYNAE